MRAAALGRFRGVVRRVSRARRREGLCECPRLGPTEAVSEVTKVRLRGRGGGGVGGWCDGLIEWRRIPVSDRSTLRRSGLLAQPLRPANY